MAVRANSDEVAALVGDTGSATTPLDFDVFIRIANEVVDSYLGSQGLTTPVLKRIETFLAAHFYQISQGPMTLLRVGDTQEEYRQPIATTKGLSATNWGQQAIALDPTGILSQLAAGLPKAEFRVV